VTQRDAERTREAVLRTAEDLFARQGFAETSLQQIGEAAGYARSTPAYFFRSKQELYDKAKEVGIEGRSKMDKGELISALRNH